MEDSTQGIRIYAAASGYAYAFHIVPTDGKQIAPHGPIPLPQEYHHGHTSPNARARYACLKALAYLEQNAGSYGLDSESIVTVVTDEKGIPSVWESNKDAWREGVADFQMLSTRKPAPNPELWQALLDIDARAAFRFAFLSVRVQHKKDFVFGKVRVANKEPDALYFRVAKALAQSFKGHA